MILLQQNTPEPVSEIVENVAQTGKNVIENLNLKGLSLDTIVSKGTNLAMDILFRILMALVIYFVSRWLIRIIKKAMSALLERHNVDMSLRTFLNSLLNIGLNFIMIVAIIGVLGVEMSSFVALFASAGLAIGMALSGTLQNFANGVIILLLKPYKVGDLIEIQNYIGTVKAVQITDTVLTTPDNKTVIIPNGLLLSGTIVNYSKQDVRRVDLTFSIAYGDDFEKAREVLTKLFAEDSRILSNPDVPRVFLSQLADSSVNIETRVWVATADYWDVYFSLNEKVYKVFEQHGLSIPFPQMDVHVHNS